MLGSVQIVVALVYLYRVHAYLRPIVTYLAREEQPGGLQRLRRSRRDAPRQPQVLYLVEVTRASTLHEYRSPTVLVLPPRHS